MKKLYKDIMNIRPILRIIIFFPLITLFIRPIDRLFAQAVDTLLVDKTTPSVLFIGNSYTFAAGSPVRYFRPKTVNDLNGSGLGGVPSLFKIFTQQAGLKFNVSLETAPGKNLDYHLRERSDIINHSWNYVIMQGYSTLDKKKPGDPALLVKSARDLAHMFLSKNPQVNIRLVSTWSRADLIYKDSSCWFGQPVEKMALDIRKGYDLASAACAPAIHRVIPVGQAWNRAFRMAVADPNPYDGLKADQINLWTYDSYHASAFGYYLSALLIFGDITGLDPRSLGRGERAAFELGFSGDQASLLQQIAYEELTADNNKLHLKAFNPVSDNLVLNE